MNENENHISQKAKAIKYYFTFILLAAELSEL